MNVTTPVKTAAAGTSRPIRVMIVDDALVARGFVKRWVDAEPDLELVGSLRDGREAIEQLERINPDVVVLDVEMPDIDGITALPQLLKKKPNLAIIMASTLTRRNAEISMKALALGALDCIPKPEANERQRLRRFPARADRENPPSRRRAGSAGRDPRARADRARHAPPRCRASSPRPRSLLSLIRLGKLHHTTAIRPMPRLSPKVLLIGSSTGGPQALTEVVSHLDKIADRVPVLITQHMPPTFTTILAEHLSRVSNRVVPRSRGRRAGRAGPHLSRARRHPYAREKARRKCRHRARGFRAGAFLQAGGRSAVFVRRRRSGAMARSASS